MRYFLFTIACNLWNRTLFKTLPYVSDKIPAESEIIKEFKTIHPTYSPTESVVSNITEFSTEEDFNSFIGVK